MLHVWDKEKIGDNITVIEAMKMEIELPLSVECMVKAINFTKGDNVNHDDVLATIGD